MVLALSGLQAVMVDPSPWQKNSMNKYLYNSSLCILGWD
jgi:hypothetical protein